MHPADWPTTQEEMADMDPEEFESFVAAIWEARGYDTDTIQLSRDRGQDVVATRDGKRHVLQAKRHSSSNRVGGPDIQQYASILHDETVDGVTIVTSSSFTKPAYQRAAEMGVDLVEGRRLMDYADSYREQYKPGDGERPSESKPAKHKTKLRGRLFAVAISALVYVLGWAGMAIGQPMSTLRNLGALGVMLAMFGLPIAIILDAIHLRRYDANYQPSLLWAAGSFMTMGAVGLWYVSRRLFRTDLRAAYQ